MPLAAWMHARSQWRTRRGSLVALAVLIAIGSTVALTALAGARRTAGVVDRYLADDATAEVIVDAGDAPATVLEEIASLPNVRDASLLAATAAFPEGSAGDYLPLLQSMDGKAGFTMQRGVVVDGRRADPSAADEVMLSEAHARDLAKWAGDTLVLRSFTAEEQQRCLFAREDYDASCDATFASPGGPSVKLRVAGVLRTGPDLRNREDEISLSFLTPAFYERYGDELAIPGLLAVRLRDPERVDEFVTDAQALVPAGAEVTFESQNKSPVEDAVRVLTVGLLLFGVVASLAASVAVGQAVLRHAATDSDARRLLRALGLSPRHRYAGVMLSVLPAVVVGVVTGAAIAYVASDFMPIGLARRAEPSRGRQFDVLVLAGGAFVAMVGIVGVAALGAWFVDRRAQAPVSLRRSWMRSMPIGGSVARAVGLRYAVASGRDTTPGRTAIGAIAIATAGVVAVLAFGAGLGHLVGTPALYGWSYDAVGIRPDEAEAMRADPDIDAVAEIQAQISIQVNHAPTLGFAIRPLDGDIGPSIVRGREPRARDEVALGADTMQRARVDIGDDVQVAGTEGKFMMRVVGQAVIPTDEDAYPLADGAVVHPDAVDELGASDSFVALAVRVRDGVGSDVYERLDTLGDDGEPPARPAPPAEIEKLEQVEALPRVLAMFLVALGVVAITHALVVSVQRRRRDFGVLRAIGFRGRDVGIAVTWQAISLAVIGGAMGLPVGVLAARMIWSEVAQSIGVREVLRVPALVLVLAVPLAVVVAVTAAVFPARRAARLHPVELLRSE